MDKNQKNLKQQKEKVDSRIKLFYILIILGSIGLILCLAFAIIFFNNHSYLLGIFFSFNTLICLVVLNNNRSILPLLKRKKQELKEEIKKTHSDNC